MSGGALPDVVLLVLAVVAIALGLKHDYWDRRYERLRVRWEIVGILREDGVWEIRDNATPCTGASMSRDIAMRQYWEALQEWRELVEATPVNREEGA